MAKNAELNEEKRKKMLFTIRELNVKMRELNKLKKELKVEEKRQEKKRKAKSYAMLEEIKVPALELLKAERQNRKAFDGKQSKF